MTGHARLEAPRTRRVLIVAQDPSVCLRGTKRILRAWINIPFEELEEGPAGHRVRVVDYDASSRTRYRAARLPSPGEDPFARATDRQLLTDPRFHAQNVYAIAMRTLARFEAALGRRVSWKFTGHQLKIAPHAFVDANAFYSREDEALMFGYVRAPAGATPRWVHTCLSHDVVAHETTHALLDGLRERFEDASLPDQAAFHEGFADVVALLSIASLEEMVEELLEPGARLPLARFTTAALAQSPLFAMAEQLGSTLSPRGTPLRRSLALEPRDREAYARTGDEIDPHALGEIFVAAMLRSFVEVWRRRLEQLYRGRRFVERGVAVQVACSVAEHLLTIAIRALDYTPPCDLSFSDYLSAILTSDAVLFPNDDRYAFRATLRAEFARFGVQPSGGGTWTPCSAELVYDTTHWTSLQHDRQEAARFLWDNRRSLGLAPQAFLRVISVRPSIRQGPDGFLLHETVVEYLQSLTLPAGELESVVVFRTSPSGKEGPRRPLRRPRGVAKDASVTLYGGGTLIFDERGRLRYHINQRLESTRQQARLNTLARQGYFERRDTRSGFAQVHLARALRGSRG